MNKKKYNPYIQWKKINDKKIIYFKFEGYFTKSAAETSLNRIAKLVFAEGGRTSPIVWNCLKMKNYEEEARNMCQQMIIENRESIGELYLISDSTVLMAAAEIISFFTENNIKLLTSEEDFIADFTSS